MSLDSILGGNGFNFDIKDKGDLAISLLDGRVVVKSKSGNTFTGYNPATDRLVEVLPALTLSAAKFIVALPVPRQSLQPGDIIVAPDGKGFLFVRSQDAGDGDLRTVSAKYQTNKNIVATESIIPIDLVTKVVSLMSFGAGAAGADPAGAAANPFGAGGNPMMMLAMSGALGGDADGGDIDPVALVAMSGAFGGGAPGAAAGGINPALMLALGSKKGKDGKGGIDPLTLMLMSGSLGNAFGGAQPAPVAPAATAPVAAPAAAAPNADIAALTKAVAQLTAIVAKGAPAAPKAAKAKAAETK